MTLTWPTSPQVSSYPMPQTLQINNTQHSHRSKVVATQPDTGPRMQRQRFTGVYEDWTGYMVMYRDQWLTAQAFFQDELLGGTLAFQMIHPIMGTYVNTVFLSDQPQALSIYSLEGATLLAQLMVEFGPLDLTAFDP